MKDETMNDLAMKDEKTLSDSPLKGEEDKGWKDLSIIDEVTRGYNSVFSLA